MPAAPSPRRLASRKARTDAHRQRVLDGAESVFAKRGYDDAPMAEIAEAAGVAIGTIYAVFPGKFEIYRAVMQRGIAQLLELASRFVESRGSAIDVLRAGTKAYVEFLVDHPDYLRMHLRDGYSWATPTQFRSEEQVAGWEQGIELMATLVEQAIDDGVLVPGKPALLAKLMVAAHQVHLADWIESGQREPRDALVAEILGHFERTFVRPEARLPE